jgi:hypothetical protein
VHEGEHDRQRRPVADILWMLHVVTVAYAPAGPCPVQTAEI